MQIVKHLIFVFWYDAIQRGRWDLMREDVLETFKSLKSK